MGLRFFLILFLLFSKCNAKHIHPEKFYQDYWCKQNNGIIEYKLIDNTRVDCLTKTHAIEFDFASKWAEAIGQSLHYSRMTGKDAGIILIIEKNDDFKYYNKIEPLCKDYNIKLSYIKPPEKNIEKTLTLDEIINFILNLIYRLIEFLLTSIKNAP